MGKTKLVYFIVQRYAAEGHWVNWSCRFFLRGLSGALKEYRYLKEKHPNQRLRIAKGISDFMI